MKNVFDVVLLNALPASGKSELRKFMNSIPEEKMAEDFHIGKNIQLDDFPYVFAMREIDNGLVSLQQNRIYYPSDEESAFDGRIWGALSILLSEDYHDVINHNIVKPKSAARYLFDRFDRACLAAGMKPFLSFFDEGIINQLATKLEPLALKMLEDKQNEYVNDLSDKTIVIEFARGGKDSSTMPLTGTQGYQYTYSMLSPDLIEKAAILYVWVDPEESRRKNAARFDPNDPGSSINHMTPLKVMLNDYGCDDIMYLKESSDIQNTCMISAYGRKYYLPIGIYDNRKDHTTQFRDDSSFWDKELVEETYNALKDATNRMWKNYKD